MKEYIVKRGDTLWGISNQFGVSVTELAELNKVNANTLKIGQTLMIPIKSGTNPDNMFLYIVQKGDSLWNIAKVYNTSVEDIKKLNYMTNNDLYIGQVIRIPEIFTKEEEFYVPEYFNYVVKKGDNLYSIARKFNISVDTLIQDNALKNTTLSIGQNLKIRLEDFLVEECFGEEYNPLVENYKTYTVKRGDSLYMIAKAYNTSVSEIKSLNNLSSNLLNIGQILKIPSSNSNTYTVQKGDSLYTIARKFNTTVDNIKKNNNLLTNNLSVGQILKI